MKCPECVKQNKESCVYPLMSYTTCISSDPFWDEKGEYHHHDNNINTIHYNCSNEHYFDVKSYNSCSCG